AGVYILLSDPVGFIAKVPTGLVAAFRATLEELEGADLLLHALDISSDRAAEPPTVVRRVLNDFEVGDRPMLTVINKADLLAASSEELERSFPEARAADSVVVSA